MKSVTCVSFLLCCLGQAAITATAITVPIHSESGVPMKTRDGIALLTDIYRPAAEGKYPVLIERTPYDKGGGSSGFAVRLASQGYVVIVQDTRGRYASEGDFTPFLHEAQDGYDAVEWAAALPYSNGKVGMYGASYVGATQWLATLAHPPHLAAVFPIVTSSDYYEGWVYRGGAFELWFSGSWVRFLALNTLVRQASQGTQIRQALRMLPLADFPPVVLPEVSSLAPYFREWLDHESDGSFWSRWSIEKNYSSLKVPAYHTGGWHDIFLEGTLRNFTQLRRLHPEIPQYLTVGPWTHYPIGPSVHQWGDLDFGPAAGFDPDDELIAWADLILKGLNNRLTKRAPVRIFVMGENVWREEQEWPPSRAQTTRYYLHSGGNAQSSDGDGILNVQTPLDEPPDPFVYDPMNPVPTTGGPLCCDHGIIPPGPIDQSKVESRPDVLVYSTSRLESSLEVTGPVRAVLYVSSDVPDTDFTAKLVDVYPDGRAYNLTEGILRMRSRQGLDTRAPEMSKDEIYRIEIDMIATSNLFQKGHRIRLEVSSSNFPRFDRNLNTGEPLISGQDMRLAHNRVFHDKSHPTALVLPVVPRESK